MDHTTTPPPATKPVATPQGQTGSSVTTTPPPAKPSTSKSPKASSGKSAATAGSENMPPLINPAWAAEVVKSYEVVGGTAARVAAALTATMEKHVSKYTKPEKLDKIVMAAMAQGLRKRGS
jgi:hypothetical protein